MSVIANRLSSIYIYGISAMVYHLSPIAYHLFAHQVQRL